MLEFETIFFTIETKVSEKEHIIVYGIPYSQKLAQHSFTADKLGQSVVNYSKGTVNHS